MAEPALDSRPPESHHASSLRAGFSWCFPALVTLVAAGRSSSHLRKASLSLSSEHSYLSFSLAGHLLLLKALQGSFLGLLDQAGQRPHPQRPSGASAVTLPPPLALLITHNS